MMYILDFVPMSKYTVVLLKMREVRETERENGLQSRAMLSGLFG